MTSIRLSCLTAPLYILLTCTAALAGVVDFSGEITPITDPITVEYKPYSGSFVTDNRFVVNGKSQGQAMQYDVDITKKGGGLLYAIKMPTQDPKQKQHVAYTLFGMEIQPDGTLTNLHMELYDPKGKKLDIPETEKTLAAVQKMADAMCFKLPQKGVVDGDLLYSSDLKGVMDSLNLRNVKQPDKGMEMIVAGKTLLNGHECVVARIAPDTTIAFDAEGVTVTMVCNGYTLFDVENGYFADSGVTMNISITEKKENKTLTLDMTSITTRQ